MVAQKNAVKMGILSKEPNPTGFLTNLLHRLPDMEFAPKKTKMASEGLDIKYLLNILRRARLWFDNNFLIFSINIARS